MNNSLCLLKTIGNKEINPQLRKRLLKNISNSGANWLRVLLYNLVHNTLHFKETVLKSRFAPYRALIHRYIDIKKQKKLDSRVKLFLTPSGWKFISNHLSNIIDRFAELFDTTDEKPSGKVAQKDAPKDNDGKEK